MVQNVDFCQFFGFPKKPRRTCSENHDLISIQAPT